MPDGQSHKQPVDVLCQSRMRLRLQTPIKHDSGHVASTPYGEPTPGCWCIVQPIGAGEPEFMQFICYQYPSTQGERWCRMADESGHIWTVWHERVTKWHG